MGISIRTTLTSLICRKYLGISARSQLSHNMGKIMTMISTARINGIFYSSAPLAIGIALLLVNVHIKIIPSQTDTYTLFQLGPFVLGSRSVSFFILGVWLIFFGYSEPGDHPFQQRLYCYRKAPAGLCYYLRYTVWGRSFWKTGMPSRDNEALMDTGGHWWRRDLLDTRENIGQVNGNIEGLCTEALRFLLVRMSQNDARLCGGDNVIANEVRG
ncbi:hypothetical protein FIBSPDRAFT_888374 [Athelia psychrophila]|uniref:Uncharacterized protein n=1 Tax=Athelia psychrophila TaxID=1759441 RepID=A0A166NPW1_9AGAM|nr:hypothetical protein FIBSPDRAFT_888374 [Fibularhizoctonia sp. CBS 109695]